ncbi:hypothetical protein Tco_1169365 [Tanacetum coccineum]
MSAYWIGISSARYFLGTTPSYKSIKDPMLRLFHRLIACNIAGRSQAPKKMTVTDLFYLRGMDVGSVNIPYLLARLQGLMAIVRNLPVIDMAELVRLQICVELDDTWAWVAPRPERQQVAMAGAPEAARDAPIVDEGAPAVPAHRLAREEDDVHEIQGALAEQREVLDSMARDLSQFSTWMVVGLSQVMSQAGVRYTSYANFQIPYVRRTRRRTDDASTSTAQQDEQQPDP